MTPLHFEKIGSSGPHIVLLHGWGQSSKSLNPLAELLSNHAQVHLIDLPGFGLSKKPSTTWSSFDYAARLIEYLDEQKIDQAIFFGHSFGGKVALSVSVQYSERVKQLILLNSSGLKRKRTFLEELRFQSVKILGRMVKKISHLSNQDLFQKWFAKKFGSQDYLKADPDMRAILVRSVNEDINSFLHKIKIPTLILWGGADTETPLEMGMRLNKAIENSKLVIFEEKGHLMHLDCGSHLCASYIIPFIK